MPFNIWCEGCKAHIGKGVRYNAEKKAAGSYFSTKIFNFRMKCHLCPNYIEIQTDPKNSDYVVMKGASKKTETWDEGEENGTIPILEENEARKLAEDPFYKLEQTNIEVEKVNSI
jgi:coiled-coil domain-containing protein 130